MRALRFARYGSPDVLRIEDVPKPSPRAGQAKVRVHAVGLNPIDWKIWLGHLRFVPVFKGPPRGLGSDFAGEIVGIGGGATERHVGERVFGSLLPFGRDGALADYIVVPYDRITPIPDGIDDAHAAALPVAGGTALQGVVDEAGVEAGQRVLIIGAAGGVGHFAVQIARNRGAHVVAVCSAGNAGFVRELGADEVVDYAAGDYMQQRDDRFDLIFDAAAASSFDAAKRVLSDGGCYINTGPTVAAIARTAVGGFIARLTSRQRAIPILLKNRAEMWRRLAKAMQAGTFVPHVERKVTLDQAGDALRDMQSGHGRGKIVVDLR